MTTFFRILRLLALVAWIGGSIFFVSAVTTVAAANIHEPHLFGVIIRGTLVVLHKIGLGAGVVYLVSTLTLIATQRDSHLFRALEILIITVMLALTLYSHFSVIPRMEADRLALGGTVDPSSADNPAHKHFDRLHSISVKVEGTILVAGLCLICLAPLPRRDDLDRVQF